MTGQSMAGVKHGTCELIISPGGFDFRDALPARQTMIEACRAANRKLTIAYRSQYEPMDRMVAKMVQENRLGPLREFIAGNSQNIGDPAQWRLRRALAGGVSLPDIGLYCLNAARLSPVANRT